MLGSSTAIAGPANIPISATGGVRMNYNAPGSIIDFVVNTSRSISGRLSSEDTETHIETVLFAMNNVENGELVQWHNTKDKVSGRIKVILTMPVSGGYCRQFFTEINKNGSIKEYNEIGCRTIDSRFWTFTGN
jgi:surface antigen